MAFYSHKIWILIIYHFYGFLWLRTNPECSLSIKSYFGLNDTDDSVAHHKLKKMDDSKFYKKMLLKQNKKFTSNYM